MVVNDEVIMPIPPHILVNNPTIVLGMNVVKINGVPFLPAISRVIILGSSTELPNTKIVTIISALVIVIN